MTLQARMNHPAALVPGAMQALIAVGKAAQNGSVPNSTHYLIQLRASQINGCSFCVIMHGKEMRHIGESDDRIFAVGAWREAPWFTPAERAALALTEAMTRLADGVDAVPDAIWDEARAHYDEAQLASLVLSIGSINLWNRLNAATRQVAGQWPN